jgi:hypothetical protein
MVKDRWYKARDHKNMLNSFNCIYLIEEPTTEKRQVKSYHLMIRDNGITQIMNSSTRLYDDMNATWFPLENKKIIKKANKWIDFIKAKNLLNDTSRRFIISIKNDKLNKIWG